MLYLSSSLFQSINLGFERRHIRILCRVTKRPLKNFASGVRTSFSPFSSLKCRWNYKCPSGSGTTATETDCILFPKDTAHHKLPRHADQHTISSSCAISLAVPWQQHNYTQDSSSFAFFNTMAPFNSSKTNNRNRSTTHHRPKHYERHYVIHDYHDFANDPDDPAKAPIRRRKGGVNIPFPIVLHRVIASVEADGLAHIFGWQPHGRAFLIHKPKQFVELILPK